jgi:eukaryotic-like serine/threonine-protein kinase
MSVPERLGKYPITGVIGRGSMGVVYRGIDPVIKRAVAIKTIRKELVEEDEKADGMSGRFRREAQAAGRLNHPGIVSVYEYGEDAQLAYIAMELVEGESLRDYLGRGARFDEHDCIGVMAQLLDALQFAHDNAIWHRDIKPANIMVMANGRIKLTDFGIARIESADFTKTNAVMGTPGFIAPEFYLGREIDQRVDLFSCGVLFYLLLAGRLPFQGRPEAVMHDVCYHDAPPPSSIDGQRRWPQYDAVVARALEKEAAKRFDSAATFRAAMLAEYAKPLDSTLADVTIVSAAPRFSGGGVPIAAVAPTSAFGPAAAAGTSVSSQSFSSSSPPPTGWSAPVLAGIEVELAKYIGPVARVIVRRAARVHKDIAALTAAVVDTIDKPQDREAFTRAVTGAGLGALRARSSAGIETPVPPVPLVGPGSDAPLGEGDIEQATQALTRLIGPIASVVAKRAAARAVSRREFINLLALTLDDEVQRERFLRRFALSGA